MDVMDVTTSVAPGDRINNDTAPADQYLDWEPYDRAAAIISFTLFVCIVVLNVTVIYTLLFRDHKKSRLHFFILHLAIADLLVGLISVLGDGIESSLNGVWYGGDVICRIWRYLKVVFLVASNNLLIGMSIDRFLAVKSPMKFVKIGNKLDKCLVAGAWVMSTSFAVFIIPYTRGVTGQFCQLELPLSWWKPYLLTVSVVVYILPTVVITACYAGICLVVWSKWRKGLKLSEMSRDKRTLEKLHGGKNKNSGLLPKAKVKSIKMTFVVCTVFFLCWTPYFVFSLLDVYQKNFIESRLYMVLGMLYPLNSACNPLIFIIFNTRMFCKPRGHPPTTSYAYYESAVSTQISAY